MEEFTSELILACCFLFWKDIHYWFNIFNKYGPVQIVCFCCVSFGDCAFRGFGPFHPTYQIYGYEICWRHCFIVLWMTVESVMMSPLSFWIFIIWILSLFSYFSLLIPLIFPKNQFLVFLVFSIDFLFSFSKIIVIKFIVVTLVNKIITAICDNVDGAWEYYAKQNESVRKRILVFNFILDFSSSFYWIFSSAYLGFTIFSY